MRKINSDVILNFQYSLIKNYLSKVFSIIEQNTNQLSLIKNDVKLRINMVDQLKKDYVMVKNEALSVVSIKKSSDISSNPTFKDKSFNLLLGIGISELLLNLVSFLYESMKRY